MAEQGIMNSQLHVLAVDDNNLDRRLIERLLKKSSYKVTTVDSGRKALEFLGLDGDANNINHVQVNMVVTDYCMPGMTGYELLKKIKDCADLTHIPVVILSSENVPARKARCLSEGAEEFIVKPVQQSDVSRLRNYMATPKCMMRLN